jgi:hypothetical protein
VRMALARSSIVRATSSLSSNSGSVISDVGVLTPLEALPSRGPRHCTHKRKQRIYRTFVTPSAVWLMAKIRTGVAPMVMTRASIQVLDSPHVSSVTTAEIALPVGDVRLLSRGELHYVTDFRRGVLRAFALLISRMRSAMVLRLAANLKSARRIPSSRG